MITTDERMMHREALDSKLATELYVDGGFLTILNMHFCSF